MRVRKPRKASCLLMFAIIGLAACTPMRTQEKVPGSYGQTSKTLVGATLGGLGGAAFGGVTEIGAPAGAVVGVLAGGAIGHNISAQALAKLNVQWIEIGDEVTIVLPADKFFEKGRSSLLPQSYSALNEITGKIKGYGNICIDVTGYTDTLGTRLYSNWLSDARAKSVVAFLWTHGIPAEQLTPEGKGQRAPIANNITLRGMSMNRHVEITFRKSPWA